MGRSSSVPEGAGSGTEGVASGFDMTDIRPLRLAAVTKLMTARSALLRLRFEDHSAPAGAGTSAATPAARSEPASAKQVN